MFGFAAPQKLPAFPSLYPRHSETEKIIALLTRLGPGGAGEEWEPFRAGALCLQSPNCRKAGPAELTFRHGEGEFPMMEVPDSLCVVLIGSQAPLKGLSCAVPPRGPLCQVLVSKKGRGGTVVEAVIHFWTTGEPRYIIFFAWFLGNFIGIANVLFLIETAASGKRHCCSLSLSGVRKGCILVEQGRAGSVDGVAQVMVFPGLQRIPGNHPPGELAVRTKLVLEAS